LFVLHVGIEGELVFVVVSDYQFVGAFDFHGDLVSCVFCFVIVVWNYSFAVSLALRKR
jgi:hypothetical protein